MAEAPGDDGAVPAFDGGFASAEHAEPLGNGARKGGLFGNVKNGAHGMTLKKAGRLHAARGRRNGNAQGYSLPAGAAPISAALGLCALLS